MPKNTETIKREIEDFKTSQGGDYNEFYIGITNDPQRRLVENILIKELVEHVNSGLFKENSPHYQAEAESRDKAVEIERFFQSLGMQGYNPRSFGRETSNNVYCFKIAEDYDLIKETEENSAEGKDMAKQMKKFENFSNPD